MLRQVYNFRVSSDELALLRQRAAALSVKPNELLRMLIRWGTLPATVTSDPSAAGQSGASNKNAGSAAVLAGGSAASE